MGSSKTIYILGSGFSKSFSENMPTMYDLTERLFRLEEEQFRNLIKFVHNLYEKSNHLGEFGDIENIANIIFSKRIFKDFEEQLDYEKLRFELIKFIYQEIRQQEIDHSKADVLYKFLHNCAYQDDKEEDVVFNFNYDLIIESLLKEKRKENHRPNIEVNYGLQFERYEQEKEGKYFQNDQLYLTMLKLHGSFNWFRAKGSESNDIRNIYMVHEHESSFSIHANDIPSYIPMTNVKSQFLTGTLYNTLWTKAIDYLNRCEEIVLIGYGFPRTDLNNMALLLDYKDKITAINVHHPTTNDKLQRLKQVFGEQTVQNMDAKDFIASKILGAKNREG